MIEGLDGLLEPTGQPGLSELRGAIAQWLGAPRAEGRVVSEERLNRAGSINRVRFEVDGRSVSIVAKRSRALAAQRNHLIVHRCLPAVGLRSGAAAILATAAERSGRYVWHVYEDLGERTLETDRGPSAVRAAVRLLSAVHTRFIAHPLLAEARDLGGEFGPGFYRSSVRDAITCLDALPESDRDRSDGRVAVRHRLLERLWALREQEHERTEAIAHLGGPETLLHGDMWLKNVTVGQSGGRAHVRLIDWDHAGVGPLGYDLSTFAHRFCPDERDEVLELYRDALADAGWELPSREELTYVFATFELGRLANCVIWPALAARDGVEGALEELAMADDWLRSADTAPDRS